MTYSFFSFFKVKKNVITLEIIIVCFIGILLTGFRDGIGNDYQAYVTIYNRTANFDLLDFSGQIEPGFNLLICVLKLLSLSPQSLFVITSFFIVVGLVDICKKYDLRFFPLIILFVYCRLFFYFNLNVLRQAIASVIIYYGLYSSSKYRRLFSIIAAMFFHISAILLLPLPLLLEIRNKKTIKFIIFISIIGVFLNCNGTMIIKFISAFLYVPKFVLYKDNMTTVSSIFMLKGLYLKYFCIYYLYKLHDDETARKLLILLIYSMFILAMTFAFGEIFNRLMLYFELYMIFSFVKIIKYNKGKLTNYIVIPFLYFYYFSAMRTFIMQWEAYLVPFKFYKLF